MEVKERSYESWMSTLMRGLDSTVLKVGSAQRLGCCDWSLTPKRNRQILYCSNW